LGGTVKQPKASWKDVLLLVVLVGACGPIRSVRGEEPADRSTGASEEVQVALAEGAADPEFQGVDALLSTAEGRNLSRKGRTLGETGYLFVAAEPSYAEISIDGKYEGQGTVFLRTVGPRYRQVTVSAPNHEPLDGYVEMVEREVVKIRLALRPTGGKVTVLTDPPGAEVRVDDRRVGTTPLTLRGLQPGGHRLTLVSGTWSWSGGINVSPTETSVISMQMGSAIVAAPAPAPVPAPVPVPAPRPVPAPAPVPMPAPAPAPIVTAPAPAPTPAPAPVAETPSAGNKPNCNAVCDRFGKAVQGSDSIRDVVKRRCQERCDNGDIRFSICAWKARNMDDVSACANLPDSR
jgi:hypothetical protein